MKPELPIPPAQPAEPIGTYVSESASPDALADAIVLQDAALLEWARQAMSLPQPPAPQVFRRNGQDPGVVIAPAAGR